MKTGKEAVKMPSPIKVCMHVMTTARKDVRVMREATALVKEGFAVYIVDIEAECNQPLEEGVDGVWVKHIIVPSSFLERRFDRWALIKGVQLLIRTTLRVLQTPADIYHAHDVSGLPACYIAARVRRKPFIFDAHELPLTDMSSGFFRRLRTLFAYLLTRILSSCAKVITVSAPIAQEIRNHYHVPEVSLIRNVVAYQAIGKSDRLRQHLALSPQIRIALYQGNLVSRRGFDKLIRAAAFLERDILIALMGKAFDTTRSDLEALIAKEGVGDRVKILPPVPYIELLEWTSSADIGLILYPPDYSLNIQMCLPNKFFEYLMAGLPVLSSPLVAILDIVKNYDIGRVVFSLTPEDIGAAINAMLADHAALSQMRRNALEASEHDFCWEKESRRLIRLYCDILEADHDEYAVQESMLDGTSQSSEISPSLDQRH